MSNNILATALSMAWFLVQLIGTLILVGAAAGAAVAGFLNVSDDLVVRGIIPGRRQ